MFNKIVKFFKRRKELLEQVVIINGIKYPSKSMIITIHDILVRNFVKYQDKRHIHNGIINDANLDHILFRITSIIDPDNREGIVIKAANLMNDFITESHCFVDGNKRTGFSIFLLFLMLNEVPFHLNLSDYKKHTEFIREIASRKRDDERNIKEIVDWFNKYNN